MRSDRFGNPLECRCCGLDGHEQFCPIRTGQSWCEDCEQQRCQCRPIYIPRPDHSNYPDPAA